jgi:hypothetical protein
MHRTQRFASRNAIPLWLLTASLGAGKLPSES